MKTSVRAKPPGERALCVYCKDRLGPARAVRCARDRCGAAYHGDCWDECVRLHGGCAVYGCDSGVSAREWWRSTAELVGAASACVLLAGLLVAGVKLAVTAGKEPPEPLEDMESALPEVGCCCTAIRPSREPVPVPVPVPARVWAPVPVAVLAPVPVPTPDPPRSASRFVLDPPRTLCEYPSPWLPRPARAETILSTEDKSQVGWVVRKQAEAPEPRTLEQNAPREPSSPDVSSLIRRFQDESAKLSDREEALKQATQAVWRMDPEARNKSGLKEATLSLLAKLSSPERVNDATHGKLMGYAFNALAPYRPLEGIAEVARPFIEKGPPSAQQGAINALTTHRAGSGFATKFIEILELCDEESGKGQMERAQKLERPIIENARALATTGNAKDRAGAVRILLTALEHSRTNDIRRYSIRYLGDLKDPTAIPALTKVATTETDLRPGSTCDLSSTACEAAKALRKCGSEVGTEALIHRFENGKGTLVVYQTLCELAFRGDEGFARVPVTKYNAIGPSLQGKIQSEMRAWWDRVKGTAPNEILYGALEGAGVELPADREDKELVTGLIEALDLENREPRYAALEILARKLNGGADFAHDFKTVPPPSEPRARRGGENHLEPAGGFTDPDVEALRKAQREKTAKLRAWWAENKSRATLVNGVWTVPEKDGNDAK